MVLSELKYGQQAIVEGFENLQLALKFMEVGVVPGAEVTLYTVAPFGDPIAIEVGSCKISMRIAEAATIKVRVL